MWIGRWSRFGRQVGDGRQTHRTVLRALRRDSALVPRGVAEDTSTDFGDEW